MQLRKMKIEINNFNLKRNYNGGWILKNGNKTAIIFWIPACAGMTD